MTLPAALRPISGWFDDGGRVAGSQHRKLRDLPSTSSGAAVREHPAPWQRKVQLSMQDHRIRDWCVVSAPTKSPPCHERRRRKAQPMAVSDGTAWTYLTVAQAAHRLAVSEKTIRRRLPALEAAGAAFRIGSAWRIDPHKLHLIHEVSADHEGSEQSSSRVRLPATTRRQSAKMGTGMEWPS